MADLGQEKEFGGRIFQNAVAFLSGEFFYRFLNFFACIFIARSLGGESYGQFSFIYVYLSFFEIFIQFGLNPVLTRELSQSPENSPRILGNAIILRTILIFLSLPFAFWLIRQLSYPISVQQGVLLASLQLFLTLRPVYEAIFRAQLSMLQPALWNGLRALLNLLLIVLVAVYRPGLYLFILTYLASGMVNLVGLASASSRRTSFDFRIDKDLTLHLLKQSFPLMLSGYLTALYYRIDVLMLSFMKTFHEVGYYSVATKLTESLNMISGALLISFFPLFSRFFKENRPEFESLFSNAFKWLSLAGLPIFLGGVLVARDLVLLFFGPEYGPSGLTFSILLGYTFFCFIGSLLANVLIACGKQVTDMRISFFLAGFNIGLNTLLIPLYSYNGAAIATVSTEIIGVGVYFWCVVKNPELRLSFPRREFFETLKINFIFLIPLLFIRLTLRLHVLVFIAVGVLFYSALLLAFRVISWEKIKNYASQRTKAI